jgi:hypothetical protein
VTAVVDRDEMRGRAAELRRRPLHDADHRAVEPWAAAAAAGLASRRDALKLVREIERLLAEERPTARQVGHAQERIEQKLELANEPVAWRRARALAAQQGIGVGQFAPPASRGGVDTFSVCPKGRG